MTDGELRGIILEKFYKLRHQKDLLELGDIVSIDPAEHTRLVNICDQLDQHALIEWKPIRGLGGVAAGMGKITARGVDVIEGTARAPITITLHDRRISVSESSNVQIGNSNVQDVKFDIKKLIAAVDHSNASDTEKAEAKSLLEKLASNKLVQAVLAALFGTGGTS